ncbi:unnamed protein product [Rhizophagus irregularis]|nr:unnamed protein product [Rhizophagus irregularis]
MPIWYPVPSALDILVGFLDAGRHLALVFFFVEWYLAVDQHLGINRRKIRLLSSNTDSMEMSVSSALKLGSVLSALGLGYADMASGIGKLRFLDLETIGSSLRFLGQLLSFYSVNPICNIIRGFGIGYMGFRRYIVQDAHLETLTLTLALNSVSEFGFRIFSYGFISTAALDSNFLFVSCFDSTADFICYLDLDFL